ncbi:PREDICTED: protein Shroom1 [Chrysochloris asiatica]|uniref:Protein Shroom1 n=1 Tax=Chrysochloris asiatica TaxID=185453 RepID=A0A9B0TX37_CHRAS|nr:PREDICTED: protein Shroom1 [Chrysochloris asiatica]
MDALGSGGESPSLTSSTRSLNLHRLSVHADSAYSSFSAASGGPEPRTPSPETVPVPYLDWDYVHVVRGSRTQVPIPSAAVFRTCQLPQPAAAALCGPHLAEAQGTREALNRQATPLLYALAAEAEATARAAEPPSPPASRAAYRQRLQGAQQRVLRETSFQRKELRMSLPSRLRPAAPARPSTVHQRSASLSHPLGEVEGSRCWAPAPRTAGLERLASQKRQWCFSEPRKLYCMGQGAGTAGECSSEACRSSSFSRPEPQDLQHGAEFEGHQVPWLPGTQLQAKVDLNFGSLKLCEAYKSTSRSQSISGLGRWGGSGGIIPVVQVWKMGMQARGRRLDGSPRRLKIHTTIYQLFAFPGYSPRTTVSNQTYQKTVTGVCPVKAPQDSHEDYEQKASKTHMGSTQLFFLPDDEVFLDENPLFRRRLSQDACDPQGLPICTHDQQYGAGLNQWTGQATVTPEYHLHEHPEAAAAGNCWQGVNGSVGDSRITCCHPPGDIATTDPTRLLATDSTAVAESDSLKPLLADAVRPSGNDIPGPPDHTAKAQGAGKPGFRPPWPSQRLKELVQELARLDPSLSDTLTPHASPEPPLDMLDGLIPLADIWAAMQPTYGETREEAGTSEPWSSQLGASQLLTTSQEEIKLENSTTYPVPDQPYGQGPSEPTQSIQAKKVELVDLLQEMLQELQAEQEQLQGAAQACARHRVALESTVGQTCSPRELERFSRFMADLERVLGLLLLLGSRLARVRGALIRVGTNGDPEERASLLQRLQLLQRQQEDAKELKEHVARRERALREVLVRTLPEEELRAYSSLLAGKAAVLAQQRSLDERVRLLQDQLDAIRSDLGHHFLPSKPAWPPGTRPPDKPPFPPPSF